MFLCLSCDVIDDNLTYLTGTNTARYVDKYLPCYY
jgi:hypothetical protein